MKVLGKSVVLLLCVVTSILMLVSQAQAATSCHKIKAKGAGQDLGGGVTVATISGGGLLQGTTEGNFTITGGATPLLSIAGTVKFTTLKATLTVAASGTFDVSSGVFSASGPVSLATGKLAGASGNLSFVGVEDLSNGSFVEDVTGRICVDLAP